MKIGVIADDFTGASDIALTLAEEGMTVTQFIGVPDQPADPGLDVGVIALKTRTAPVSDAVTTSLAACNWCQEQGATQFILKVCSTFDSTANGNIGPVLDALAERLGANAVPVCPAFPENGRSVYQGHLFVADRLLNESGMEDHPLTPMKDPDLRRVLASQSRREVRHIPAMTVQQGALAVADRLSAQTGHIIIDAITDTDLRNIGRAAKRSPLLCGGSGIAIGLPANFGCQPKRPFWAPIQGPGVVLSGSCSRATRAQVTNYSVDAPSLAIDPDKAAAGEYDLDALSDWVLTQEEPPLIYSSADPDVVRAAQDRLGASTAAGAIERLFAGLSAKLVSRGLHRLVVAGGETSGAVVNALGATSLRIGPRAAAGVPLLRHSNIALALKSGNFGQPAFFRETLDLMETHL